MYANLTPCPVDCIQNLMCYLNAVFFSPSTCYLPPSQVPDNSDSQSLGKWTEITWRFLSMLGMDPSMFTLTSPTTRPHSAKCKIFLS